MDEFKFMVEGRWKFFYIVWGALTLLFLGSFTVSFSKDSLVSVTKVKYKGQGDSDVTDSASVPEGGYPETLH